MEHIPVMLQEVLQFLDVDPCGIYVDLTLGRAGHSSQILKKIKNGTLYAFDKDREAIEKSGNILSKVSNNFELIHSDFRNIKDKLDELNISSVNGIFIDLGVSSPQLDEAHRGFSYSKDGPLDMRMNQEQELSANNVVNEWDLISLIDIFRKYGNVKMAGRIADNILKNRPIKSTLHLVDVIRQSLPSAVVRKKNPAKAVFQAIRIAVNDELEAIHGTLVDSVSLLKKDSILAVITFHSLEDKIVKSYFKELTEDKTGKMPIIVEKKYTTKKINPSKEEVETNRRSRSARLRILRKL